MAFFLGHFGEQTKIYLCFKTMSLNWYFNWILTFSDFSKFEFWSICLFVLYWKFLFYKHNYLFVLSYNINEFFSKYQYWYYYKYILREIIIFLFINMEIMRLSFYRVCVYVCVSPRGMFNYKVSKISSRSGQFSPF